MSRFTLNSRHVPRPLYWQKVWISRVTPYSSTISSLSVSAVTRAWVLIFPLTVLLLIFATCIPELTLRLELILANLKNTKRFLKILQLNYDQGENFFLPLPSIFSFLAWGVGLVNNRFTYGLRQELKKTQCPSVTVIICLDHSILHISLLVLLRSLFRSLTVKTII